MPTAHTLRTSALPALSVVLATTLLLPVPALAARSHHPGRYEITLTGKQIPGKGDPRGVADAVVTVNPKKNQVCWDMTWHGLAGKVTAMHLHSGAKGKTGPHVVDLLEAVSLSGKSSSSKGCATSKAGGEYGSSAHKKIEKVLEDPADFYLNVHSTKYPHGAIRAQLG